MPLPIGHEFTYYNFNLYKSEGLSYLRTRILGQLYDLFETENKQCAKVLMKIVHPGGDIDKSLYAEELPIYEKIISDKLDHRQSSHCKFIVLLSEHLQKTATAIPESWNDFINSDIQKLSDLLKPDWKDRKGKSLEERQKERLNKISDVVNGSDWPDLEQLLLNVNSLYNQEQRNSVGYIQASATNIYIAIARKDKAQFENALRLHFSGKVYFPLSSLVFHIQLQEEIITAEELFSVLDSYAFEDIFFWESVLVTSLPEQQINEHFLKLLLALFGDGNKSVNVHHMQDYLKYWTAFENYKAKDLELGNHNIITYLTSLILTRKNRTSDPFGYDFFSECAPYFSNHTELLKSAYWAQHEIDPNFDYVDKELKAMLDLDRNFIHESFTSGAIGVGYSAKIDLSNVNTSLLWEYPEYEDLVENLLFDVVEKERFSSTYEQAIFNLFSLKNADETSMKKAKSLIIKLTQKYTQNDKVLLILIEMVYNNYYDWIIPYYREFLLLRKDIEITKNISFGRAFHTSGS